MPTRHVMRALALVLALVVTGCSDTTDDTVRTSTSGKKFNSADVAFATDMIPHHAQALSMVDLTLGRDLDPAVESLAEEIRAGQTPEIEQMSDWLQDWDEPIPETMRDHANAHGEGMDMGEEMPGMMSSEDIEQLEQARGPRFEQRWLEMMIEHHEGAVEMAQAEQDDGAHADAVKLAERVESTQTDQVDAMEQLLGG